MSERERERERERGTEIQDNKIIKEKFLNKKFVIDRVSSDN